MGRDTAGLELTVTFSAAYSGTLQLFKNTFCCAPIVWLTKHLIMSFNEAKGHYTDIQQDNMHTLMYSFLNREDLYSPRKCIKTTGFRIKKQVMVTKFVMSDGFVI